MKPQLIPEWRRVLTKAWSVRLMALTVLLCGLEAVVSEVAQFLPIPHWGRMLFIAGVVMAAMVAKFVYQPRMRDEQ